MFSQIHSAFICLYFRLFRHTGNIFVTQYICQELCAFRLQFIQFPTIKGNRGRNTFKKYYVPDYYIFFILSIAATVFS